MTRTVSFQGLQLSAGQRRQIVFLQKIKPSVDFVGSFEPVESCDQVKPVRIWSLECNKRFTPWLGDVFGY